LPGVEGFADDLDASQRDGCLQRVAPAGAEPGSSQRAPGELLSLLVPRWPNSICCR
jgi:hypothetical protein